MARIVVAGAGAIGASIAYHLALAGADDVVLCDRAQVGAGSTGKAMGGVRQQFSTAPEVRLAQASIRFFEQLGPPFFEQVGYVFLATSEEGLAELEERRALQEGLGVPATWVDAGAIEGLEVGDVVGAVACWEDGIADPARVTRELVRQATERGVELVEGVSAVEVEGDVLVVACGPWSAESRTAGRGRVADPAPLPAARRHRPGRRPAGRPPDGRRGGDRLSFSTCRRRAATRDGGAHAAVGVRGAGRRRAGLGLATSAGAALSACRRARPSHVPGPGCTT